MNHKNNDKIKTWMFLGFLGAVAAVSMVMPQKAFSSSENRYLQKKPDFSTDSLLDGSYGKLYEAYLSDQFPGRDRFVGLKVGTERLAGKTEINGVYLGKDGYLMEGFQQEDLEGQQLETNIKALTEFTVYAAEQYGEDHVRVMLVPSASQIMTEQLPFLAAPYDQSILSDRFVQRLESRVGKTSAEAMTVPVKETLKAQKGQVLYYKTDHHWTAKGAFAAYEAWARSVGLKPWSEDGFLVETVSQTFCGTIYSKLNIPWTSDTIELYYPREQQEYSVIYDRDGKERDSLYSLKALEGKDQYAVYLDGNHSLTDIFNKNAGAGTQGRKLLILKDSYAHSFAPFAANHFEQVVMADLRYLNVDLKEWMKEEQFTDILVLYQIPGFATERSLGKLWLDK